MEYFLQKETLIFIMKKNTFLIFYIIKVNSNMCDLFKVMSMNVKIVVLVVTVNKTNLIIRTLKNKLSKHLQFKTW